MNEQLNISFHILRAFTAPHGVNFDSDFFGAEASKHRADAGIEEALAVPCHGEFHNLGKDCVAAKQCLMG